MAWWESCGYRSRCLPPVGSEGEEEEEDEDEDEGSLCSTDSDSTEIHYVLGDVTHPHTAQGDAIIVHCVGTKAGAVTTATAYDRTQIGQKTVINQRKKSLVSSEVPQNLFNSIFTILFSVVAILQTVSTQIWHPLMTTWQPHMGFMPLT